MGRFINLTGQKFGKITEYAYLRDKIKLIAFKIKEELEERKRDAKIIENIKSI